MSTVRHRLPLRFVTLLGPTALACAFLLGGLHQDAAAASDDCSTVEAELLAVVPDRYPPMVGGVGTVLAGKIPSARYVSVKYTNEGASSVQVVVPHGLVYGAASQPERHALVVVLAGVEVKVAPGSTAMISFYTLTVDRRGAKPVDGVPLRVLGRLPESLVYDLIGYRTMDPQSPDLARARAALFGSINHTVAGLFD